MKRKPNHIDDPHEYEPCKCACCDKCWRHKIGRYCIHGGPFTRFTEEKTNG